MSALMMSSPICVAPTGDRCGEGAVWHAAEDAVYWTDVNRFLVHRFTLADQCVRTWFFDEPVTALVLTNQNGVLTVVLGSRVIGVKLAEELVKAFLGAKFTNEERHKRRLAKIAVLEQKRGL